EESCARFRIACADPAVDTEGHRDQAFANQPIGDEKERRNAGDLAVALRKEKAGLIAAGLFDDALPAGQQEEGALRMAVDEGIPAQRVLFGKGADARSCTRDWSGCLRQHGWGLRSCHGSYPDWPPPESKVRPRR